MKRIHDKSILDCYEEKEQEEHANQIDKIIEKVYSMRNYDCIYTVKYMDKFHEKHREVFTIHDELSRLDEVIEGCDLKNGVDAYIDDEGNLAFLVHGQGYEYDGGHYLVSQVLFCV